MSSCTLAARIFVTLLSVFLCIWGCVCMPVCACMYVHACMCVCIHVCVCMHVFGGACIWLPLSAAGVQYDSVGGIFVRAIIRLLPSRTYIRGVHTCLGVCMHLGAHASVCACMFGCVHACLGVCMHVCMQFLSMCLCLYESKFANTRDEADMLYKLLHTLDTLTPHMSVQEFEAIA